MGKSAAKPADGGMKVAAGACFVPSCIILRDAAGKLSVKGLSESSDPALTLRDALKRSKGRDPAGLLLYTDALPIIRGRAGRRLKFTP